MSRNFFQLIFKFFSLEELHTREVEFILYFLININVSKILNHIFILVKYKIIDESKSF